MKMPQGRTVIFVALILLFVLIIGWLWVRLVSHCSVFDKNQHEASHYSITLTLREENTETHTTGGYFYLPDGHGSVDVRIKGTGVDCAGSFFRETCCRPVSLTIFSKAGVCAVKLSYR